MRLSARIAACVVVLGGALACSGSESVPGAGGAAEAWTLDNYCARFAERWCEAVEPRCIKDEFIFGRAGCEARYIAHACEPLVALVREHRATFQLDAFSPEAAEASVDECIASWAKHFDSGRALYGAADLAMEHNVICNAFGGIRAQGDSCHVQAECKKTFQEDRFVMCLDDEGVQATAEGHCSWWNLPTEGESCNLGDACSSPEKRLYCQPTDQATCSVHEPCPGACIEARPLGTMWCNGEAEDACGMDAYCDHDDTPSICRAATKGVGKPCAAAPGFGVTRAPECMSRFCAFGRCTHPLHWFEGLYMTEVFLGPEVCNGGGG